MRRGGVVEIKAARELMAMEFAHPTSEGYVYVMRSPRTGLLKIGRSADPWKRLERLSRESREDLELLDYWFSGDCVAAEWVAHRRFARSRVFGEWFYLGMQSLDKIGRIVKATDPGLWEGT